MPDFEPVVRERFASAADLINLEIARLQARRERLQQGLAGHRENIRLHQEALQSVEDEIKAIAATVESLGADCKKLNGHAEKKK